MSSGALATAGALATMTAAYRLGGLTSFLLGKTVEAAAGQAIELTIGNMEPGYQTIYKHSIQYTLMEMDVEAKVAAVRSLVKSIEHSRREEAEVAVEEDEDYVLVAAHSLNEIMDKLMATLHRIYDALDDHAQKWMNSWRKPYVFEDLDLLRAQCKVFDKRLDTLTKCLSIHLTNNTSSTQYEHEDHAGELSKFSFYNGEDEISFEDRTVSKTTTESLFFKDDAVVL